MNLLKKCHSLLSCAALVGTQAAFADVEYEATMPPARQPQITYWF